MKGDTVAHLVGRVNRLLWRPWLDCSRMFNGGGVGGLRPRHSGRPRTSRPRTSSCRACGHHNTQRSKGNAHGHTGRVWAAASLRTACAEREATNNRAKGGDLTAQHASCSWRQLRICCCMSDLSRQCHCTNPQTQLCCSASFWCMLTSTAGGLGLVVSLHVFD